MTKLFLTYEAISFAVRDFFEIYYNLKSKVSLTNCVL